MSPTPEELAKAIAEQEKRLRDARKLLGPANERERQRLLMREKRSAARDITILPPADLARRKRTLRNVFTFLTTYFGEVFYQPFTSDRRSMVQAILHAASYSGDFANAGPRGEGKTRLALYGSLWLMLAGKTFFPVVVSKNQQRANSELSSLKDQFEHNDLFAADFPEVCEPIRELEGWASRARMQTVSGWQTRIHWGAEHIVLPTIPDGRLPTGWPKRCPSCARGQIMASVGIDGPIRGMSYRDQRPTLAILDDIDDRESAASDTQTATRRKVVEQDIAGLAGPGQRISRVMLCTVINRRCIAYQYTDRRQQPSWRGERYRAIVTLPEREDLWEEFLEKRRNRGDADPDARASHAFYLANRKEMDTAAVLANPYNFTATKLTDGSLMEVSALEHCYNLIADTSWADFATEYQNDPPVDDDVATSGINAQLVSSRVNGLPRRVCPNETVKITAFCDLGKHAMHWAAAWWLPGCIGGILDYGVIETHGMTATDNQQTIERALLSALLRWRDDLLREPFVDLEDRPRSIDMALIDSGDWPSAVYEFCRQVGGTPFAPSKGIGSTFRAGKPAPDRRVGEQWYLSFQPADGIWLANMAADYWKRFCHERFLTPTFDEGQQMRPGSLSLFTPSVQREHHAFAHHICAEQWAEEFVPGRGLTSKWKKLSRNNHWLDCAYGLCAAASMVGVRILNETQPEQRKRRVVIAAGASRPDGRSWLA